MEAGSCGGASPQVGKYRDKRDIQCTQKNYCDKDAFVCAGQFTAFGQHDQRNDSGEKMIGTITMKAGERMISKKYVVCTDASFQAVGERSLFPRIFLTL